MWWGPQVAGCTSGAVLIVSGTTSDGESGAVAVSSGTAASEALTGEVSVVLGGILSFKSLSMSFIVNLKS